MRALAAVILLIAPVAAFAWWRSQPLALPVDSGDVPIPETDPGTEPTFLDGVTEAIMKLMRGERNNNPGNIRKTATPWQGKVSGVDTAFETFASPEAGIRALAKQLKTYQQRGLRTVRQIITTYAPASENNTAAYIAAVASTVGVGADTTLDVIGNPAQLTKLVTAIIQHENGRVIYSAAQIASAVQLA
jgi:hypothetical protein